MTPWALTMKPCTNRGPPRQRRRPRSRLASSARPSGRATSPRPRRGRVGRRGAVRCSAPRGGSRPPPLPSPRSLPLARAYCVARGHRQGRERRKPSFPWFPSPRLLARPAILSGVGSAGPSCWFARGGLVVHVREGLAHLGALRSAWWRRGR